MKDFKNSLKYLVTYTSLNLGQITPGTGQNTISDPDETKIFEAIKKNKKTKFSSSGVFFLKKSIRYSEPTRSLSRM